MRPPSGESICFNVIKYYIKIESLIDNLSIAVRTFVRRMFELFLVDAILLLRYVNMSINFRSMPLSGDSFFWFKTHELCSICVHVETHVSCCFL